MIWFYSTGMPKYISPPYVLMSIATKDRQDWQTRKLSVLEFSDISGLWSKGLSNLCHFNPDFSEILNLIGGDNRYS